MVTALWTNRQTMYSAGTRALVSEYCMFLMLSDLTTSREGMHLDLPSLQISPYVFVSPISFRTQEYCNGKYHINDHSDNVGILNEIERQQGMKILTLC